MPVKIELQHRRSELRKQRCEELQTQKQLAPFANGASCGRFTSHAQFLQAPQFLTFYRVL